LRNRRRLVTPTAEDLRVSFAWLRSLRYWLWATLMVTALAITSVGIQRRELPLYFNLTYAGFALCLAGLERILPHELAWRQRDGQLVPDLAHTLLTKLVAQVLVISSGSWAVSLGFGGAEAGRWWPASWPVPLQCALGLVVLEFGLYWAHRLAHEWPSLWRFHAVHHSSVRLWFLNTGRFHFIDTLKSMLMGLPLLAALGAPGYVFEWCTAFTAFCGMLTHCNIDMPCGPLNYVFNTPALHRWHHSMDLREGNKNYGENLMIFDLLFGTFFDDTSRRPPAVIGITETMPPTFFAQLAAPFRRLQR
jgi:ornithine lipid hydroxylase